MNLTVTALQKLHLKPNDVLVVKVPEPITDEFRDNLAEQLQVVGIPRKQVLLMTDDVHISILTKKKQNAASR